MTTSTSNVYFQLQARATEEAQAIEFAELMAASLWEAGTKEGVRYDVKADLQTQACEWDEKAYRMQAKLDNFVDATKSAYGFTLHT